MASFTCTSMHMQLASYIHLCMHAYKHALNVHSKGLSLLYNIYSMYFFTSLIGRTSGANVEVNLAHPADDITSTVVQLC